MWDAHLSERRGRFDFLLHKADRTCMQMAEGSLRLETIPPGGRWTVISVQMVSGLGVDRFGRVQGGR